MTYLDLNKEKEIIVIEVELNDLYFQEKVDYPNEEYNLRVNQLEKRKTNVMTELED